MILYEHPLKIELLGMELLVNGKRIPHTVRYLGDMRTLFLNSDNESNDIDLYYMYRDVYSYSSIRFDITVLPVRQVGKEYVKTHGHIHPVAEKNMGYPEVYQVLFGSASFILQKLHNDRSYEVLLIDAKKGDVILIPPNFGHATINTGNQKLVLSNVVSNKFEAIYGDFKKLRGAAYYLTTDGIVQNTNYVVRNFEKLSPAKLNSIYNYSCKNLFSEFYTSPEKFIFLEKPSLIFK